MLKCHAKVEKNKKSVALRALIRADARIRAKSSVGFSALARLPLSAC
jgi:hypothetical protein